MPHGFGAYGIFPFDLGGGDPDVEGGSFVETEHNALLRELEPAFDVSEDTDVWLETLSEAIILAGIWAVNQRLRGWLIPLRMMESLPIWEQATGLRPGLEATAPARRRTLDAKLGGMASNAIGAIETAAQRVLGAAFGGLVITDPSDQITYWPGVNPGPPGFEWSTNRVRIGIIIDETALGGDDFVDVRARVWLAIEPILRIDMTLAIGVGSDFTVGISVVGKAFL